MSLNPLFFNMRDYDTISNYYTVEALVLYSKSNFNMRDVLHVSTYVDNSLFFKGHIMNYALKYLKNKSREVDCSLLEGSTCLLNVSPLTNIYEYIKGNTKYNPIEKRFTFESNSNGRPERYDLSMYSIFKIKKNIIEFLKLKSDSKNKTLKLLYDSENENFITVDSSYLDIKKMVYGYDINTLKDGYINILDYKNNSHTIQKFDYFNFLRQEVLLEDYYILEHRLEDLMQTMMCFEELDEFLNFKLSLYKLGEVV